MNPRSNVKCAAVLAATLLCGCAVAGDGPDVPWKAVKFDDLNLNNPAGVATLYKRIRWTARYVCKLPQGTLQLVIESELKACEADATDRAIQQARLPSLNALHLAKTGRRIDSGQYAERR